MAITFGLITEGPTDQVVLKHLLAKYFSDPDIDTRPVQPNTDSTDKADHFGGWKNVFTYCSSPDMATSLEANSYTIIQVDTDVCEDFGVKKRVGIQDATPEEIVENTKSVIVQHIGIELYKKHEQKIIFAISHSSIECWLLPLFFTDNNRCKTINCCDTLNQELRKKGYTIDCGGKKTLYHNKICSEIRNKAQIQSISAHNSSFNQFILRLATI